MKKKNGQFAFTGQFFPGFLWDEFLHVCNYDFLDLHKLDLFGSIRSVSDL